jgi:hypothetical protein
VEVGKEIVSECNYCCLSALFCFLELQTPTLFHQYKFSLRGRFEVPDFQKWYMGTSQSVASIPWEIVNIFEP